ncbi:hypothetical protein [Aeromicrobium sp.]|uniref:hypothetical protein n=1 Tax=Aeromicrobium sp. TaxID=1871063 RepID=UPI0028A7DFC5|nr:hypothetical protein [Aeromicrobium sp.]
MSMSTTDDDPRHVFLSAGDVLRRYGWGKTRGYQNLKDREMIPPPVVRHPDRWRLDQLMAWEERQLKLAEAALNTREPAGARSNITDLLPQPKRRRRPA